MDEQQQTMTVEQAYGKKDGDYVWWYMGARYDWIEAQYGTFTLHTSETHIMMPFGVNVQYTLTEQGKLRRRLAIATTVLEAIADTDADVSLFAFAQAQGIGTNWRSAYADHIDELMQAVARWALAELDDG